MTVPALVLLVVSMTIDGEDYINRKAMPSIEQCFAEAAAVMEQIRARYGAKVQGIGVGCFVDEGDPA